MSDVQKSIMIGVAVVVIGMVIREYATRQGWITGKKKWFWE